MLVRKGKYEAQLWILLFMNHSTKPKGRCTVNRRFDLGLGISVIINLARGKIIDEIALYLALKNGQLRGMCMTKLLWPIKGGLRCPCTIPRNIIEQPIHLYTGPNFIRKSRFCL